MIGSDTLQRCETRNDILHRDVRQEEDTQHRDVYTQYTEINTETYIHRHRDILYV